MAAVQPRIEPDATAAGANREGNTVQIEEELLSMNQNTMAHALETKILSGALLKLRLAITGRSA